MGYDITDWLNKYHKEWYYLYSDTGEFLRHSFKPPEDATHYRHKPGEYKQVGVFYKIEMVCKFSVSPFLSYMIPGYSDWRCGHVSTMKADIEEVEQNCFKIAWVEGPFEK